MTFWSPSIFCTLGLLARYPDKPVGLVESEKTAVICAALIPQFVWLATGGKSQLNERLNVLRGRKVTAFPDIDGYEAWTQKLAMLTTPASHPEAKPRPSIPKIPS